jgi:hypothetical protein
VNLFYRLIDLSDENITELKLPDATPEDEAAVDTTERMAENAADQSIVSSLRNRTNCFNKNS